MVALTAAERKRRSRAHGRGDHTLCDPARCDGTVTPAVTTSRSQAAPARLGRRGKALWEQLHEAGRTYSAAHRALVEEACRLADRLERLDQILHGDATALAQLVEQVPGGTTYTLVVNSALTEARLHATSLKQLVAELRQASSAATAGTPPGSPAEPAAAAAPGGGGALAGIADLSARIAARRNPAPG